MSGWHRKNIKNIPAGMSFLLTSSICYDIMKKDGSDVRKRYRLAILTAMNVTPEEWETYDYHTISLNEREQEDEEESEENEE